MLKKVVLLAIAGTVVAPWETTHAQTTQGDVGCEMISAGIAAGVAYAAYSYTNSLGGAIVGGALTIPVTYNSQEICEDLLDALAEGFLEALAPLIDEKNFFYTGIPYYDFYCLVGAEECVEPIWITNSGSYPELDLFVQQSWGAVSSAMLQIADQSNGNLTITTSVAEFSQEDAAAFNTYNVITGFAAPTNTGGYWKEP